MVRISALTIDKLVELGIGDTGRLRHLRNMVEQGQSLYATDRVYLENLIGHFLSKGMETRFQELPGSPETAILRQKRIKAILSKSFFLLSLFFKTGFSKKTSNLALVFGRLGLGLAFMYQGYVHFSTPGELGQLLVAASGWGELAAYNAASLIGIIEVLAGIFVLIGFLTRLDALVQTVVLVGEVVLFAFLGPLSYDLVWKDVGLLGLVFVLLIMGSGKWGIDYFVFCLLEKRRVK